MEELIARMERIEDLDFEIRKRLGDDPGKALDRIAQRMAEMEKEIARLQEKLYVDK